VDAAIPGNELAGPAEAGSCCCIGAGARGCIWCCVFVEADDDDDDVCITTVG
jgi:hypothetical protein